MKLTDKQELRCAGVVVEVAPPASAMLGLQHGWIDEGLNTHHQVVGTVKSVAGHLCYTPHDDEVAGIEYINRGNFDIEEIAPADGKPFVSVGDRVYFSAAAHADSSRNMGDGCMFIPHWMVFGRVVGERVLAAPGYCLVVPEEDTETAGLLTVGKSFWVSGRVESQGASARYHYEPDAFGRTSMLPNLEGKRIFFRKNRGIHLDHEWLLNRKVLVVPLKDIMAYE